MDTTKPHDPPHDEMPTGVDPTSVTRGYEEDVSNVSGIWSIPIAVGVFIVLGIIVAAFAFRHFNDIQKDPLANPVAAERNEAPINDRMGRIGRAGEGTELKDQPRLEGLQKRETTAAITPSMTSRPVLKDANNPPYVHPEDLKPNPASAWTKPLYEAGWLDKDKVARIPITEAMKISLQGDFLKALPKDKQVEPMPWEMRSAASNAGRGLAPAPKDKHDH